MGEGQRLSSSLSAPILRNARAARPTARRRIWNKGTLYCALTETRAVLPLSRKRWGPSSRTPINVARIRLAPQFFVWVFFFFSRKARSARGDHPEKDENKKRPIWLRRETRWRKIVFLFWCPNKRWGPMEKILPVICLVGPAKVLGSRTHTNATPFFRLPRFCFH